MPKPPSQSRYSRSKLINRRQAMFLGMGAVASVGTTALAAGLKAPRNSTSLPTLANLSQRSFAVASDLPLRQQAAAKGLLYGAAVLKSSLVNDAEFSQAFARECAILVPEGALKWDSLRPAPDKFNFTDSDWLLAYAHQNGLQMRGHTLVWHHALPQWFAGTVTAANAEKMMVEHIQIVAGRYVGKFHSWDVVNEAIALQHGHPQGLRNTPWLNLIGPKYIDLAFRTAAVADPKALLVYNDFGLDYDTPWESARRQAVLQLLERLVAAGTPIHALGIQAHLLREDPKFNPAQFQTFLRAVASLGLKIMITELDVTDARFGASSVDRDRQVAAVYEDYLTVALAEPAVIALLTWGLSDRYTWLTKDKDRPRRDGLPPRPLPLDAQLNRKLAWQAIARSVANCPKRP
jgi:endo-1,4-beta-xylanase